MLTKQLSHIITNLLKQEPLVVLPGFGGFVKDRVGSKLNEISNRITPPSNTVVFNSKLSHNDGLLMAAIAMELEIPYAQADTWLTDAVSEIQFQLANSETVVLPGLGEISKSLEDKIEFKAAETPDIQTEFFGLKPISISPIEQDNVDKVKEFVAADGPVATKVRTLPVKKVMKYAAAAAAIGFFVWLPMQQSVVNNGKMLVHQLNPFAVSTEVAYESREFNDAWLEKGFEQKDMLSDKFNHEFLKLHLTENSSNAIVVKTDAVPSTEVHVEDSAEPVKTLDETATEFKVIAATFASKNEAADYVANMIKRGFGAEYAGIENGQHLVAYGTYDSLEDANKMLRSVSMGNKRARILSGS